MTKRLKNFGVRFKEITSNKNFVKKVGNVLVAVAYVMFVVALASEVVFAADNSLLGNISDMLKEVKNTILTMSTFAVVIGVGIGAMMKKFSMGKQDKIEMGTKLMKDSIIAYIILNLTPRIVTFVIEKIGTGGELSTPGI